MTINTGGPVRGFIGRWLMRMQAVQGIIGMVTSGVTAASTLTFALQSIGYASLAPWALGTGVAGTIVFAYGYEKYGLYNRKNRENSDRGNNYSTARDKIDDTLIGAAVFAAVHGRMPEEEELDMIESSVDMKWQDFRDGVDLE